MARSSFRIGLTSGIGTLQTYTAELCGRAGETSRIIQNGIEQVLEAKKLVSRDIQSYTKEFSNYSDLLDDPTYTRAQEAVKEADTQVKSSLHIIHNQSKIEKMEKSIQAHTPKRQLMDWSGKCCDYSIYRDHCLQVRTMKVPPTEQLALV